MSKYGFFLLGLAVFGACKSPEALTPSDWPAYDVVAKKQFPPLDPNQWSYPWYVMEISPGDFENILGDPIQAKDTAHLVHNSNCMVTEQIGETPLSHKLPFCRATRFEGVLMFEIYKEEAVGFEVLYIRIRDRKYQCQYYFNSTTPMKILNAEVQSQHLQMDKATYRPGDTARGKVSTDMLVTLRNASGQVQSIKRNISGYFETVIKE